MRRCIVGLVLFVVFAGVASAASVAKAVTSVNSLPGVGKVKSVQYAGYASTATNCAASKCTTAPSLYYWLITADNDYKKKPLIIWFNGGPGSSSMYGPFMETGAYQFDSQGKLVRNPHSWTKFANYMIVEQPLGVGASLAHDFHLPRNNEQSSAQFYNALQNIVNRYPFLAKHKIYLAGESYAGTMLPYIALRMQHAKNPSVQLGGLILNDIWVNPIVQQRYDSQYAISHGMIDRKQKQAIDKLYRQCAFMIKQHTPSTFKANTACGAMKSTIEKYSGLYMLNIMGAAPNYVPLADYLSRTDVQSALHMQHQTSYPLFSDAVSNLFTPGLQDSVVKLYQSLLNERTPIMMMSGLLDATDCNFIGMDAMIQSIRWSKQTRFNRATITQWHDVDKTKAVLGYLRVGGGLTQVKVLDGGHMLPLDQPKVDRLVKQFVNR